MSIDALLHLRISGGDCGGHVHRRLAGAQGLRVSALAASGTPKNQCQHDVATVHVAFMTCTTA